MKEKWTKALGQMTYGIYVLTSAHGGVINGMIASWVSQVSHEPTLVLVAVHPRRYSHQLIARSGRFALHAVSRDRSDWLARFKGPDPAAKFSSIPWTRGKTGCPILEGCLAYVECEVRYAYTPGNHTLFVGEVVEGRRLSDAEPLTTRDYRGSYTGAS